MGEALFVAAAGAPVGPTMLMSVTGSTGMRVSRRLRLQAWTYREIACSVGAFVLSALVVSNLGSAAF